MPNLVEVHETIKEKKDKIQQTIHHSIKISGPRPSIILFIFQLEVKKLAFMMPEIHYKNKHNVLYIYLLHILAVQLFS